MTGVHSTAADVEWQRPIGALSRTTWPIVVVGAGPAGSIAALHLAGSGCDVLLLDRAHFPREKTCGDCLIPDALGVLDRAGLLEEVEAAGHHHERATIYSPSGYAFEVTGRYLTLHRRFLDAILARGAARAGAHFYHGQVRNAARSPGGSLALQVDGHPRQVTAQIVVLATGTATRIARQLGFAAGQRPSAAAIRAYVRSDLELHAIVGSYRRELAPGYGWIFPMGAGLYNVGVSLFASGHRRKLSDLRRAYETFLREFPAARELLSRAVEITLPQGAPIRCGLHCPLMIGNVLGVGETIGSTLPFTAEGIGKAMQTAEIAADTIIQFLRSGSRERLEDYPRRLQGELKSRYRSYELAERWLGMGWLNDFMSWWAGRNPRLRERVAGILSETVDPREVFSLPGILRSFFSRH